MTHETAGAAGAHGADRMDRAAPGTAGTDMAVRLAGSRSDFEADFAAARIAVRRTRALLPLARVLDRAWSGLSLLAHRDVPPPDRPIFLTGSYRSGTTILERLLAAHPDVATFGHLSLPFPRSPGLARLAARLAPSGRRPTTPPDQPNLELSADSPFEGEPLWLGSIGSPWTERTSHVLGPGDVDPPLERRLRRAVAELLRTSGRTRFLNKNPLHTLRVAFLARVFPDACFVHVVRHPHRVLRSQLDLERMWARVLEGLPGDWGAAFADTFMPPGRVLPRTARWREIAALGPAGRELAVALSIGDFEDALRSALLGPPGLAARVHRLRYEELLAAPSAVLRPVLAHAGLEGAGVEELLRRASALLDRGLRSATSPLPRFAPEVEQALRPLVLALGYEAPA